MSDLQITYLPFVCGKLAFLKGAGLNYVEQLEKELPNDGIPLDTEERADLRYEAPPQAGALLSFGLGIVAFLASCAAKKLFDEVYAAKIRPKLVELWKEADRQHPENDGPRMFKYQFYYDEQDVHFIIALYGDTFDAAWENEPLMSTVHDNAIAWAASNPGAKVHVYLVKDGSVNVAPFTFETMKEADAWTHTIRD